MAALENGRKAIFVSSARDTRHKSGLHSKTSGCLAEKKNEIVEAQGSKSNLKQGETFCYPVDSRQAEFFPG